MRTRQRSFASGAPAHFRRRSYASGGITNCAFFASGDAAVSCALSRCGRQLCSRWAHLAFWPSFCAIHAPPPASPTNASPPSAKAPCGRVRVDEAPCASIVHGQALRRAIHPLFQLHPFRSASQRAHAYSKAATCRLRASFSPTPPALT